MPFDAVLSGFYTLTYADTYLAGVLYFLLYFPPSLLTAHIAERHEHVVTLQFLRHYLPHILRALAMAVFMLVLTPLIIGQDDAASWGFPWHILQQAPAAFAKLIGALLFAEILLSLISLLRQLHALHILVLGVITLHVAFNWLGLLDGRLPSMSATHIDWLPDITLLTLLTASAGLLSWLDIRIASQLVRHLPPPREEWVQLLMFPLSAATGFSGVFIYGAWLGRQISA